MNIDKYVNMNREEFLEFLNLDYLIPIDDIIEYKGKKYKLPEQTFYSNISCHRINHGYDINFTGKIEQKLAQMINQSTLAGIDVLVKIIENDLSLNRTVRYEEVE